ncbi:phage integrase family protein [Novosphingobium sp. Rr 2-17]|uniref:tyrosine-type recombinase/integrase n=1 Tax=Novosphingobium sp. Rr 2-17 TaxID=555793 RepID=UPI0002699F0D|nr:tyrosine-type recombinase/integrase [Novosphingobium sp. Rr 2-17]EIZ77996.1 phage integrase family protein [Novosphingobium sp. Rr 2-17]
MSLAHELDRYLSVRRSLGYDLATAERALRRFVQYADEQGVNHITTDLFLRWQNAFGNARRSTWGARFIMVRLFSQWLHGIDAAHEVLPRGLVPYRYCRTHPYIFTQAQIAAIIEEAAQLPSIYGIRGLTCSTLFGLIAVTGMRINEALSLDTGDVDLDNGLVHIRCGKLGKERLLPVHDTAVERLRTYVARRDRLLGRPSVPFFIKCDGGRLGDCGARYNFAHVCQRIGLREPQTERRHGRGPRIHDLRHSFAARTMIDWYKSGKDPAREMIKLSTWLGHAKPDHTYWYIEAVPELLELASARITDPQDRELCS